MSVASVLRIGPSEDHASAALLRKTLLSWFKSDPDSNAVSLSNKYFSAAVGIEYLGTNISADDSKEDGILLVFDSTLSSTAFASTSSSSSFDALSFVHDQAEQRGECGELLRLCVGVSVGQELQQQEEEYSRRILWCLDRGYEYVEVDLSEAGIQSGHDERDKDGFARLVEAIMGTVWSSAQMESASRRKEALKQTLQLLDKEEEKKLPTPSEEQSDRPTSASNMDANANANDETKQDSGAEIGESKTEIRIQETFLETTLDQASGESKESNGGAEERVFKEMEKMMGEASRIREASRSGTLTDEERRKRAGDAAMLMMGFLDKLDLEDDLDSDDDSSAS